MTKFLLLLKTGKYKAINQLLHGSETRKKWVQQFIGLGTFIVFFYLAADMAFKYGTEKLDDAFTPLLIQFINVFMTIGIVMTIRDSMEKVVANFYEDEDIYLLISAPVNFYSVVSYKYVYLIFATLFSMVVWLITPWVAFGRVFDAPWQFYVAMIPTLAMLLMIINASVAFVFMIINRYFSSHRVMRVFKTFGIIMMFLAGVGIALFGMWGLDNKAGFVKLLSKVNMPRSGWYPHVWVANILTSFLDLPQIEIEPLGWIVRLISVSIGVVAFVIFIGRKIYYRSWELFQEAERVESQAKKKKIVKSQKSVKRREIKSTIILKDIRTLTKDTRQVLMFVMLSVIIALTIFAFQIKDQGEHFPIAIQIVIYAMIISNSLSWKAFKKEGKSWWLLQSSPISPAKLYHAKLLLSCSVAFLYAEFWLVITIIALKIPLRVSLLEMLIVGIISLMIASINTSIGSFPWVAEIGPAKDKSTPIAKVLTRVLAIVLIILILAGPLILIILSWDGKIFDSFSPVVRKSLAVLIVMTFYITISFISYFVGKRNVTKLMFV